MYSRILKFSPKMGLLGGAALLAWMRQCNLSADAFEHIHRQAKDKVVRFHLNGRLIGQGAVLKNGLVVTHPDIFSQQQASVQAFVDGQPQAFTVVRIDEGIAVLKLASSQSHLSLASGAEIGQNVYMLGVDEHGNNEYQQCPVQDSNSTLNMKLTGEEYMNVPYPFLQVHNCYSTPGTPLFNASGELVGLQLQQKRHGKTQVLPASYFKGLEAVKDAQIVRPYFGCTLKTSDEAGGGAFIIKINTDSPAEKAGLRLGEVIKAIDGQPVIHGKDVTKMLGYVLTKSEYRMTVSRDGKLRTVSVQMK